MTGHHDFYKDAVNCGKIHMCFFVLCGWILGCYVLMIAFLVFGGFFCYFVL